MQSNIAISVGSGQEAVNLVQLIDTTAKNNHMSRSRFVMYCVEKVLKELYGEPKVSD